MSIREMAYLLAITAGIGAFFAGTEIGGAVVIACAVYVAFVVDRTLAKKVEQEQDNKKKVEIALRGSLVPERPPRKRLP